MKKILKLIIFILILIIILNLLVVVTTKKQILDIEKIKDSNFDCIVILGASVKNNKPSAVLEDRLKTGIELYDKGVSKKILVSGDNVKDDYNEVNVMKNYLLEQGIPSEDIFVDHYGISTYDSIYRTKEIYKVSKVLIVTQEYHLYRSLYIAKSMNLDAYGISSDIREYTNIKKMIIREVLARCKEVIKCLIHPESKYLGEIHIIEGNGDKTNEK